MSFMNDHLINYIKITGKPRKQRLNHPINLYTKKIIIE